MPDARVVGRALGSAILQVAVLRRAHPPMVWPDLSLAMQVVRLNRQGRAPRCAGHERVRIAAEPSDWQVPVTG